MSKNAADRTRWGLWPTIGLSCCVMALFFIVQTLVAAIALGVALADQPQTEPAVMLNQISSSGLVLALATIVSAPICIGLIALFIRLRQGAPAKRYLELKRPSLALVGAWSLATVAFMVGVDALKSLVDRPVAPTFTADIYETAYSLPLLYLAIVVAAPVFEEVFFRGFLFQGIRHSWLGATGAVLVTSLVWAVIHLQYDRYDMAGIFLFGVLLAIAQLRTQSLYIPITMHALNNLIALIQVAATQ
ncbi:MAG: CPBP family intramembrane glutamic endopeptidase [Synechococcales bacterium]|nr:CPBP family intramembrane glutamic endopeptidase [Synechococcales bacterium]